MPLISVPLSALVRHFRMLASSRRTFYKDQQRQLSLYNLFIKGNEIHEVSALALR